MSRAADVKPNEHRRSLSRETVPGPPPWAPAPEPAVPNRCLCLAAGSFENGNEGDKLHTPAQHPTANVRLGAARPAQATESPPVAGPAWRGKGGTDSRGQSKPGFCKPMHARPSLNPRPRKKGKATVLQSGEMCTSQTRVSGELLRKLVEVQAAPTVAAFLRPGSP